MNIYHIQDSDRPMHVLADSWGDAIATWRMQIALENEEDPCNDMDPEGVTLIAKNGTDFPDLIGRFILCGACGALENMCSPRWTFYPESLSWIHVCKGERQKELDDATDR